MWCRRIHRQLLGMVKRQHTGHHYLLLQHHSHRHKQHRHKRPTMAATIEGCERRFGWNWAYGRCVGNVSLDLFVEVTSIGCMEGLQTVGYSFLPNWGITCLCKCSMKTAMRYFVLPILTEFICRYVKMQLCPWSDSGGLRVSSGGNLEVWWLLVRSNIISLPNQDSKRHPQPYWVWRPASRFLTSIIIIYISWVPPINLKLEL
jgi:hypothetical protein